MVPSGNEMNVVTMKNFQANEDRMQISRTQVRRYGFAIAACCATALFATPLLGLVDLANIVMLFLLAVVLIAARLGRGPAVLAAFLNVLLFDIFFVPPRFSLAVNDVQYLITFAVMLVVALIIGRLAGRLRQETNIAVNREQRTHALYELTRDLSGAISGTQVAEIIARFVGQNVAASAALLLPDKAGELAAIAAPENALAIPSAQARAAYERGELEVFVTDAKAFPLGLCLPLKAPMRVRGVLMVTFRQQASDLSSEHRQLLDAVASLTAIVIERIHYVEVAQAALVNIESERLRNSLLSALSHDLRTPLTVLVGLADTLARAKPPLPSRHGEIAGAIRAHAMRMSNLVHNLLEMARLQAGKVKLNKEWQLLEEVIGSSLKSLEIPLASHRIITRLPEDLPLLEFDAVLIERVLVNLLENAIKYAPDSEITIEAQRVGDSVEVSVADNGPGLPRRHERNTVRTIRARPTRGYSQRRWSWACDLPGYRRISRWPHSRIGQSQWRRNIRILPAGWHATVHRPGNDRTTGRSRAMKTAQPLILVIEDEPEIRRFVCAALVEEGWRFAEAASAAQGFEQATALQPAAILLDLGLPDRDGVKFIGDVRSWSSVPIVVMSARSAEAEKIAALDAGADDYVTKPFGIGELLARVRVALRRHEPSRSAKCID